MKRINEWWINLKALMSVLWEDVIIESWYKLVSAIKSLVMIGDDVYFANAKPKNKRPKVFSLYFGLIGSIIIGAFFAVLILFGVRVASEYYLQTVYLSEDKKAERQQDYLEDLGNFISENNITATDASKLSDKLSEWIKKNKYVYLTVRAEEDFIFSSMTDNEGEDGEGEDDSDDGGDGILSRPSREEILEKAETLDYEEIIIGEGDTAEVLFVYMFEYTEYLYKDLISVFAFVIAVICLAIVVIEHFGKIISRIKRLQYDVNEVASGRAEHQILATGYDEITALAYDVDEMRLSMLENVRKEKEALEMNTELITSMSHDIRTPLTVLMGYIDIMKSGLSPEETEEYILASEKTVLRLKQISDDMFKYFRAFGRGGEGITMEEYDASTLFEQMLSEHVLLLGESGYDVDFDIEELTELDMLVKTDAPHLMRIIDNIFSNLYKYASRDHTVSIKGRREGELAIFEFKNTATRNAGAESSKVGLKTCKRLSEYILDGFEYYEEDGIFTLRFSLKLYDEGTKISESFIIR